MKVVAASASRPAALRAHETDDEDVAFDAAFGAADGEHAASVAVTESYQLGADAPPADQDSRDAVKPRPPDAINAKRVDTTPLEGIRTVACAIIAANHWLAWYGRKKHGSIELQGGFAVTVFFFITGFVMYLAYGDKVCREDFKYWVRSPEPRRAFAHPASRHTANPRVRRFRKRRLFVRGFHNVMKKRTPPPAGVLILRRRARLTPTRCSPRPRPRFSPYPPPSSQDFMKRRYIRLLPVHWLCVFFYAPIIYYNYRTISEDYYFWQNKSGTLHLWAGWALNPLFLHSWIFAPLHYWNSVGWSVSTQIGFYFLFPALARRFRAKTLAEETSRDVSSDVETGAVAALDASRIEARYRWRARWLYILSFLVPFAAMVFFNNPAFREYWADPNVPRDAETGEETVTELGSDIDGIRAYFIARSWTPFRLPVFFLGMLFGAWRLRAARTGDAEDEDVRYYWARLADRYSFGLSAYWILSSSFSLAYAESKSVRLFSEFFLIYPAAYVIYGLTIAGEESRAYRLLTHPVMRKGGQISYAAYLLQFPVWSYVDWFAYGTFKGRFPPCSRDDPKDVSSWTECFAKSGYQEWPDVMVVWNVFLLFAVAYFVNRFYEQRVVAWASKKFLDKA